MKVIIWNYIPASYDHKICVKLHEGVSRSFRNARLERELQMLQLSATRCSCVTILWVSLVSFASIILCVASRRVLIVVVVVLYFAIDSVRQLLDTPSYHEYYGESYQYPAFVSFQILALNYRTPPPHNFSHRGVFGKIFDLTFHFTHPCTPKVL
jgi:hypothetical protein